jgi:RNA-directed DNA polymerase
VISNLVLDALEQGAWGSSRFRRPHPLNYGRGADEFIVTANSREVLEEGVLPRIDAFLAERGVWLSTEKTLITPLWQGFDFLGQTLRNHERYNGKPAYPQQG